MADNQNTRNDRGNPNDNSRDRYRDNDDVRAPLEGDAHTSGNPSTRSEARGDARENVGNTSRGTDADPTGSEGNDKFRGKSRPDEYDSDLEAGGD